MSTPNNEDKNTTIKSGNGRSPFLGKSFAEWLGSFGTEDAGIDLGTSKVTIYVKNKGIVLNESSVVAYNEDTRQMIASGNRAAMMEGRTPHGIKTIRPLAGSNIVDYGAAAYLLSSLTSRMSVRNRYFHPRLMMCVPGGVTGVQRRALLEAAVAVGARKTVLIEQPLAAALGSGMDTSRAEGSMIVDIGGGSTDVAVLSKRGIVVNSFIPDAGMTMDQTIISHVRDKYRVQISQKAAEKVKIELGANSDINMNQSTVVGGSSLVTGLPIHLEISSADVSEALHPILNRIFHGILSVLQKTPPALLADIRDHGILMVGGGSRLRGLDAMVTRITGIPAYISEYPEFVNAVGAGVALSYMDMFRDSLKDLH